jgi:hypothetical protein
MRATITLTVRRAQGRHGVLSWDEEDDRRAQRPARWKAWLRPCAVVVLAVSSAATQPPKGVTEEQAHEAALQLHTVQRAVEGRRLKRAVYVPDRLINLVYE